MTLKLPLKQNFPQHGFFDKTQDVGKVSGAVLPWTVKNFEYLGNESVSDYAFQSRNYMIKNFISRLVYPAMAEFIHR